MRVEGREYLNEGVGMSGEKESSCLQRINRSLLGDGGTGI